MVGEGRTSGLGSEEYMDEAPTQAVSNLLSCANPAQLIGVCNTNVE